MLNRLHNRTIVMKYLRTSFIAIAFISCTGCMPSITWLPDSSGFVYTTGRHGDRLMYLDLAKKEPQTLVNDTKCETLRAAVSPDGKRSALARITHLRNEPDTYRILVYDLTGKLVHSSRVFSESGFIGDENRFENTSEVFWGPADFILINKVAFSAKKDISNLGNAGGFVLYDLKSDRIIVDLSGYVLSFDGKPFRPDGKSFLAANSSKHEKTRRLSLVDLAGNVKPIALKPPPQEFEDVFGILPFSALFNSSWRGNVAAITSYFGRLEIDTDRLEASFQPDPSYSTDLKEAIRQKAVFSNGARSLQILLRKTLKHEEKSNDSSQLVLWDLLEKKTRVLSDDPNGPILFPSPNGKYVAVRWIRETDERPHSIWVIDQ